MRVSLLVLVLFGVVFAADDLKEELGASSTQPLDSARILASKQLLSNYAVENMDYVIQYDLYNVGDRPALKVVLDDRNSFPTNSFDVVKGLLQVRWERIPPGGNVTHSVIVRPRNWGAFNYTAAHVTYYPSEDAKEVRIGQSVAPGEGYIYRQKDYDRRFATKFGTWVIFVFMAAPTIVIPYLLWYQSKSKYSSANTQPTRSEPTKKQK